MNVIGEFSTYNHTLLLIYTGADCCGMSKALHVTRYCQMRHLYQCSCVGELAHANITLLFLFLTVAVNHFLFSVHFGFLLSLCCSVMASA